MSQGYLSVGIRAGPMTPADRSGLDQIPASEAREPAVAPDRAVRAPAAPPRRARVPSDIHTQETMIPNGWFG
jgi:hypothetical protein